MPLVREAHMLIVSYMRQRGNKELKQPTSVIHRKFTRTFCTPVTICCITLCVLQTSKEFGFFCSVNHLSGPLRFVIRDWWISIRFLCFVFQGSLLSDRPVSGNNRLVTFVSHIFQNFLILVTSKNKATSASFLRQKMHSPYRDFLPVGVVFGQFNQHMK